MEDQFKKNNFSFENVTIGKIIDAIHDSTRNWNFQDSVAKPWYRAQDRENSPIPGLFRENGYDEFLMNTTFRNRASILKENAPETDRLDKWLFMMQHYGLPTRLLDWTESLLNSIFLSLDSHNELNKCEKCDHNPTIWILHPYELNKLTEKNPIRLPNTWARYDRKQLLKKKNTNTGSEHFRLAFERKNKWEQEINLKIVKLPIAIHSNYFDARMLNQQSCFTIHGTDKRDFVSILNETELIEKGFFQKFVIPSQYVDHLYQQIKEIGLNRTTIFPDLDHFAKDMKDRFRNKSSNK